MDFAFFDKAQEQFGLVSGHTNRLRCEIKELEERLLVSDAESSKLKSIVEGMETLKRKHSRLIEERDRLIMERELMRKRVGQMVLEVDTALALEAKKE